MGPWKIGLKRECVGPIHYSLLAERLGISPFTAYDMLCLLEEKGFVTSAYQLPADKNGPGRAERVFYPSELAQAHQQRLVEQIGNTPLESESVKLFVMEKLRDGAIALWGIEYLHEWLLCISISKATAVFLDSRQCDARDTN